ncbi:MAG: acyltransferase [Lachnospira sp.]|nr:acyltransferase [Lachnospira sp.]
MKRKSKWGAIGDDFFFQPRNLPTDTELIYIGNNVNVASDVVFVNHDIIGGMLNRKFQTKEFGYYKDKIVIGSNVAIGTNVIILPGVTIGDNVIIGAGAIVSKDLPSDSVCGGVPARVISSFDEFVEKRRMLSRKDN